jgi:WXG100 family type VII secretion target
MPDSKTRADYDQLAQIAKQFSARFDAEDNSVRILRKTLSPLQNGGWVGVAATAFFEEMSGTVLPSMDRMVNALQSAARTTELISQDFKRAEEEAAKVLRGDGVQGLPEGAPGSAGSADSGNSPAPSDGGSTSPSTAPQAAEPSGLYKVLDFLTSPTFQGPRDFLVNVAKLISEIKPWVVKFAMSSYDEINKIIEMAPVKGWKSWLLENVLPKDLKFGAQFKDALGLASTKGLSLGKTLLKRLPLITHIVDQGLTLWKHYENGTLNTAEMWGEVTKNLAFFGAGAAATAGVVAGVGAVAAYVIGAPVTVPATVVAGIGLAVGAGFAYLDHKYGGAISGWFTDRYKDIGSGLSSAADWTGSKLSDAGDWMSKNVGGPISRWGRGLGSVLSFG